MSIEDEEALKYAEAKAWRSWLERNHSKSDGVWLLIRKKNSRGRGIRYDEAVEDAICFGWIDGKMRSLDEHGFILRFSPRKSDSVWSELNKKRAIRMIEERKMRSAGLEKVEEAKASRKWDLAYSSRRGAKIPKDVKAVLKKNKGAWENFSTLPNSRRVSYIYWIETAKRIETRRKRIDRLVYNLSRLD